MVAIIKTDEDEVRRLLESSPDLTERAQDGNSLFHLAASVGSAGCLRLLLQKWQMVYMTTDMIPVLTEVNLSGSTVLHLAALRVSDQHLRTLVDYCPQLKLALRNQLATNLRQLASPECLRYLDSLGDSLERVCTVYIVCRLTSSRHIIGQVKIGATASWQWLTQALFNLFIRHMQSLHRAFSDERPLTLSRKARSRSDPFPDGGVGQAAALGLSPDAVESFSAGPHRWRRAEPAGTGRGPHQTLCELQVDELLVTLRPAEDAAYGIALPLNVLHNYVRLLEGHHGLVLDVPDGWDRELLGRAVLAALSAQQPELPLVRLASGGDGSGGGGGAVLAHLDPVPSTAEAARRAAQLPPGSYLLAAGCGLESGGTGGGSSLPLLQLRPDAAPLSALPGRRLMRRLLEAAGGTPPAPEDAVFRTCRWAAGLGGRLLAAAARRRLPLCAPGAEAWAAARVAPGEPWRLIRWVQRLWETDVVPAVAAALGDPTALEETLLYLRDAAVAEDCPLSGTDRDYLLSSFETRPAEAAAASGVPEPAGSPGKRPRTPRHALRGLAPLLKKLPASPRHGRDS